MRYLSSNETEIYHSVIIFSIRFAHDWEYYKKWMYNASVLNLISSTSTLWRTCLFVNCNYKLQCMEWVRKLLDTRRISVQECRYYMIVSSIERSCQLLIYIFIQGNWYIVKEVVLTRMICLKWNHATNELKNNKFSVKMLFDSKNINRERLQATMTII